MSQRKVRKGNKERKRAISGLNLMLVWDAPGGGYLTKCRYCGQEVTDSSLEWMSELIRKQKLHEIMDCPKRQRVIECPGCGASATEGVRSVAGMCHCGLCYVENFGWFFSPEHFKSGAPAIPCPWVDATT